MYSMHHRNSAAWGREAEEERERERREKKKTNKREKQNKKEEEKMKKKKHERKERREKNEKRKRLRGHIKYSLTTLQFWRLKPGQPGSHGAERPDKSWVSTKVPLGAAARGGGRAAPCACPLRSAPGPWAQCSGAEPGQAEKKEEKLPLFFPHRRRQVQ